MKMKRMTARLARLVKRWASQENTGLRGYVEGIANQELFGWAFDPANPAPFQLGLFTRQGLLATTTNGRERADVREAGFGDGRAGFGFVLNDEVLGAIAAGGGEVVVKVLNREEPVLDTFSFSEDDLARFGIKAKPVEAPPPLDNPRLEMCRSRLFVELGILRTALGQEKIIVARPPANHPLHQALFAPQIPENSPAAAEKSETSPPLPAYLDFTRYRYRVDLEFDTDNLAEERAHFLDWYLKSYGNVRQGRRIPLSREMIDYLNAPIIMAGQRQNLSRAMWWHLARQPQRLAAMQANGEKWYIEAGFWWANEGALILGAEDCLIPDFVRKTLAAIDDNQSDLSWPLSVFIHRFYRETPGLHFLDGGYEQDRALLSFSLMLMALRRPDLLCYIPRQTLQAAFVEPEKGGPAPFEAFLRSLLPEQGDFNFSRQDYAALLRIKGFDLDSLRFLTIDSEGHRYHAAALPEVSDDDVVDVQMIGPFEKASGLGQATRLSASAMAETGLRFNKVDFGLDNPAPEGFSTNVEHGAYKRARINLIHLNAESIPNAFAYEPDVFNGAYNIGYFFWELDSPAACHHLSFDLLDEIWVSSQFGVDIYQPHTDIPVTRIGMCFEEMEQPRRKDARMFVREQFHLSEDVFVFLVAFDSFSFVQRKNPVGVLKAFQAAFEGVENVRLIVKTQNRDKVIDPAQYRIWRQVEAIMESDPRILLMNETLSYQNLIMLKKGSDCYISLHRSEGWGFGMIEAMNLKVPVICTGYSGNMEFCSSETAWLVDYKLIPLGPDDYIFARPDQHWAEPDIDDAARQMRAVYDDPETRARKISAAHAHVQETFSSAAIGQRYQARLDEILAKLKGTPI